MARLLGVVDRPEDGRRPSPRGVPRLGGLALFFGIFVPSLAFLPLGGEMRGILLGAAVATTVGAVDDFRGLRWFEKLAGQTRRRLDSRPASASGCTASRSRSAASTHCLRRLGIPLTVIGIVALMNMVNFLDGLDGLAAGVCAISGLSFCIIDLSRSGRRRRHPDRDRASAPASASCATTSTRRASSWATPARSCSASRSAAVSVQGLLKTAVLPTLVLPLLVLAVPGHRHLVRRRQADQAGPTGLPRRPHPPAPPLREHRLLAAPRGRSTSTSGAWCSR